MKLPASLLFASLLLCPAAASAADKTVYGLHEHVQVSALGITLDAKLDTGARTASLSAHNIKRFTRDGERWVRFTLGIAGHESAPLERPLARISKIKRRAGDYDPEEEKTYTSRPVIELDLCMGRVRRTIEVNLTDRTAFSYPLLIGSEALKDFGAVIDPSLMYAAGQPGCTSEHSGE